jgi:hypothetical protein
VRSTRGCAEVISFSSLEDEVIEPSDLSEDEKSALWLHAWSFVHWRAQRREARAHIARLTRVADAGADRGLIGPPARMLRCRPADGATVRRPRFWLGNRAVAVGRSAVPRR